VLDGRFFCQALDGLALIEGSAAWTEADHQALKQWFGKYLQWLKTHEQAVGESEATNNHGTYFDVQISYIALFLGERAFARSVLETAIEKRILAHIKPDGSQPEEMARTRTLHYCLFNMEAMMQLGRLGEFVGVDLWNAGDARIRAGMDFIAPYADPSRAWPYPTILEAERTRLLPLLLHAAKVYLDPRYEELARKLPADQTAGRLDYLAVPRM
jgi:hypothetical protein